MINSYDDRKDDGPDESRTRHDYVEDEPRVMGDRTNAALNSD